MSYEKKNKSVKGIEISYYKIKTEEGYIVICPCHDAALFSDDVLRGLLLSSTGGQIIASAAISVGDGKIAAKISRL